MFSLEIVTQLMWVSQTLSDLEQKYYLDFFNPMVIFGGGHC